MAHAYVKENETFNTVRNGVVPKPTQDEISANKVLRADGSWVEQSGGGGISPFSVVDGKMCLTYTEEV